MDEHERCDDDIQTESLTDLPVTDGQADSARGGAKSDPQGRVLLGTEGGIWRG